MKKTMLVMLSLGSLIMFASTSEAGRGRGHRGKGRGGMLRGDPTVLKAQLGLSDAQVAQIKAIRDAVRARTKAQRDQIRPLRKKMHALMQADVIDAGAIYAVRSQMRAIRQVLQDERFKAKLQVLQQLTKEQRDKMKLHRMKRWHGEGEGKGFGRSGRFGGGFGGNPSAGPVI